MVIKSFQMPIENGHWESNFFNGYFSPIVVEICLLFLQYVYLTGGLASFQGLQERMERDLLSLRPFQSTFKVYTASKSVRERETYRQTDRGGERERYLV